MCNMIYKVFEMFAAGVNAYMRNSVFKFNFEFTLERQTKPQRVYFMRVFAH